MKYNNGEPIDFDLIKLNRKKAVRQIAEGNFNLAHLLDYCIDNNIRTYASCGDTTPYISIEIDDNTRDIIYPVIRKILINNHLFESIGIIVSNTGKKIICSFYLYQNDYNINKNNFFDIILAKIIKYGNNKDIDIEEFYTAELLLNKFIEQEVDGSIEFMDIKSNSYEETMYSQYRIIINMTDTDKLDENRDYINDMINEKFPMFIYGKDNIDYVISMKYYDINNYNDLVLATRENSKVKIKKM